MSLQVIAPRVAVYEVTGTNDDGQLTANEHVFVRGDVLPDYVQGQQAFVLVTTGMAAEVGDQPDESIRPAEAQPAPVLLPEHSATSVVATGVPAAMDVTYAGREDSPAPATAEGDQGLTDLPDDAANKAVWEDYAVTALPADYRLGRGEAEAMRKADLVAEVKARYSEARDLGTEDLTPPVA